MPPAIITSASPRWMISKESPIACARAEQAVHVAEFGPLAPKRIETWPAARLMMADGMKNGEILRGPPSSSALCSRSMVLNPPMPAPMKTPTRRRDLRRHVQAGVVHGELRRRDGELDEDVHLLDFFFLDERAAGRSPCTSPAIRVANCVASNFVIGPDAALAGQQRLPVRLGADAERRHQADARDDDSPSACAPIGRSTSWSWRATRCTRRLP